MGEVLVEQRLALGPLTADFSPPSACYALHVASSSYRYDGSAMAAATCYPKTTTNVYSSTIPATTLSFDGHCYPANLGKYLSDSDATAVDYIAYMSPATGCPAGFSEACTYSTPAGSGHNYARPSLAPGETLIGCCFPGYSCYYDPSFCTSVVQEGQVFVGISYSASCASQIITSTLTSGTSFYVNHPAINLLFSSPVYHSGSRLITPAADYSAVASGSSAPLSSPPSGTESSSPQPSSAGLSPRAKIAIATVIPIVFVLILAALFFLLRRRFFGPKKSRDTTALSPSSARGTEQPEPDGAQSTSNGMAEIRSISPAEQLSRRSTLVDHVPEG